ncbi:hypothetical protein AAG906_017815 [Vitis piasezkii]
MASHLPRFLTAACRMMMTLPSPQCHHNKPKVFLPLKGIENHLQLRGSASTLVPSVGSFTRSTAKMFTPSEPSSARGDKGYFE